MKCYRTEIFGPVLLVLKSADLSSAITLINDNEYGNGAAVFTRSGAAAGRFHREIEAGQVGVNVPIPVPLPMFSFTGNKRSVAGGGGLTFYGMCMVWSGLARSVLVWSDLVSPVFPTCKRKVQTLTPHDKPRPGKPALYFYTQTKTVTSLWRSEDAVAAESGGGTGGGSVTDMPTQS